MKKGFLPQYAGPFCHGSARLVPPGPHFDHSGHLFSGFGVRIVGYSLKLEKNFPEKVGATHSVVFQLCLRMKKGLWANFVIDVPV